MGVGPCVYFNVCPHILMWDISLVPKKHLSNKSYKSHTHNTLHRSCLRAVVYNWYWPVSGTAIIQNLSPQSSDHLQKVISFSLPPCHRFPPREHLAGITLALLLPFFLSPSSYHSRDVTITRHKTGSILNAYKGFSNAVYSISRLPCPN